MHIVAAHQPIVLDGLTHLFAREQDFCVLASLANSAETLKSVRRHRPAVLVLDVSPPAREGLTVLREMQKENLPTRAVVFAGGIDEQEIAEAIRLGPRGVVLKEMAPRLLPQCIRKVHAGGEWFETCSIGHLVGRIRRRDHEVHGAGEEAVQLERGIAQGHTPNRGRGRRISSGRRPSSIARPAIASPAWRNHEIEEEGTGERLPILLLPSSQLYRKV